MNLRNWKHSFQSHARLADAAVSGEPTSRLLSTVQPQATVRLVGYLPGLPPERRTQLQAYGLLPGQILRVLQHNPVTVIQVGLTELALDSELANVMVVE